MLDSNGYVKIGVSEDPKKRVLAVQIESKRKVVIVHPFDCGELNGFNVEHICHLLHENSCIGGEWFNITMYQAISTIKMVIGAYRKLPNVRPMQIIEHLYHNRPTQGVHHFVFWHDVRHNYKRKRKQLK